MAKAMDSSGMYIQKPCDHPNKISMNKMQNKTILTETIYKNRSYRYIFKMVIYFFHTSNHIQVTMYQYMWEQNVLLTFL